MTTKEAVEHLVSELKKDKDYYISWQANIAMATKDEFARWKKKKKVISYTDMHSIANNAAKDFLNLLCTPIPEVNKDEYPYSLSK